MENTESYEYVEETSVEAVESVWGTSKEDSFSSVDSWMTEDVW